MIDKELAALRSRDAAELQGLSVRFESTADALAWDLVLIVEYLKSGAPLQVSAAVSNAFVRIPDCLNHIRFLLGAIEPIARDAERAVPWRK